MRRLRILTWHIHGNYLWYLSQIDHDFFLPTKSGVPGYGGRGDTFPFGPNVHDVPAEEVQRLKLDCILFQHRRNYDRDRHEILSPAQLRLPTIYLEHDPPLGHPTDHRHWYEDPSGLLVHVTPFNALMWDSGRTNYRVIDHGVPLLENVRYRGELDRGLTVVNNLGTRGRRLGPDVFLQARQHIPIDLVGMGSELLGGMGEIKPLKLPAFEIAYRFFFNPIRYTSLGLAVCEAMMLGMPIVGLATTEMAGVIDNGATGFLDTKLEPLVAAMQMLLRDPGEARRIGDNARQYAQERFAMNRFIWAWEEAFADATASSRAQTHARSRHHVDAIGHY